MESQSLELIRLRYLPPNGVKVLFVGESPPAGGTFFYHADSNLFRYTKEAFCTAFKYSGTDEAFLDFFRDLGCFLDDLCHEPVNRLNNVERRRVCKNSVAGLATRMEGYSPEFIIVLMKGIGDYVRHSLDLAHMSKINQVSLPYPSHGNQRRYIIELINVLKELRSNKVL